MASHPEHGPEEMCPDGMELYRQALSTGHVTPKAAEVAPCLIDFGLLRLALDDPDRLEAVSPVAALHRLLRTSEEEIAGKRRRETQLIDAFSTLIRSETRSWKAEGTPTLRLLNGKERIGRVIGEAMACASEQLLCVQPHDGLVKPPFHHHEAAMERDQEFLNRGGRILTLYQHTVRNAPYILARYEQLTGNVEARTLDEVTERLIVVDHTVAFIPASPDRTLALEVRHPALLTHFVTTFDRLWRLATPMFPRSIRRESLNGITPRQRAIAALLIEGHTDSDIADRLGMNVRTARVHIAKLAATLGSNSRAQLGYLIAESGVLKQEGPDQ
ncbi:LuxR C-terminal-related transcriptional regulator [Streptomyces sp. NPDC101133]|uniref:helix-turn-helix transcriptional regulator n=1 Tax=Streptomyces sp. NPDC101133 TaxID=3366111 RepID=UPI0038004448